MSALRIAAAAIAVALAVPAAASDGRPPALEGVGIEQRLGERVPLDLRFRDEAGAAITLEQALAGKPAVLSLVYYRCPMLCGLVLDGLVRSLRVLAFDAGSEFRVITVSIDPKEGPALAAATKKTVLGEYRRDGAAEGWRFLTGEEPAIRRLAESVGFGYAWDAETEQYAHAGGIMVITPDGRLARYFYGVEYSPRDLRFALVEASEGRIGTLADRLLLFCYHYDPATGRYGAAVMRLVRLAGALTVLLIAGFLLATWLRESRARRAVASRAGRPC